MVSEERRNIDKTTLFTENGIKVLRVKTGNIYNVGFIEKGMSFITVSFLLKCGIKKYLNQYQPDFILFSSPPVTYNHIVSWAMSYFNCPSFLMMKDIFPQNAVDIGLFPKNSLIYKFFRNEEKRLYRISTVIGCMSPKNIDYIKEHNPTIDPSKLILFPNTCKVGKNVKVTKGEKEKYRKKYHIRSDSVVAVFGGNFGKPQNLDFLLRVMEHYKENEKVQFLLIGSGTEKERIFNYVDKHKIKNVVKYNYISRKDYTMVLRTCDIGLIFLDPRFTIPNYPSKSLSYFECQLPILAAIDVNNDFGSTLEKIEAGYWVESRDLKPFIEKLDLLIKDKEKREKLGKNGRIYFEEHCDVKLSVKILENKFK